MKQGDKIIVYQEGRAGFKDFAFVKEIKDDYLLDMNGHIHRTNAIRIYSDIPMHEDLIGTTVHVNTVGTSVITDINVLGINGMFRIKGTESVFYYWDFRNVTPVTETFKKNSTVFVNPTGLDCMFPMRIRQAYSVIYDREGREYALSKEYPLYSYFTFKTGKVIKSLGNKLLLIENDEGIQIEIPVDYLRLIQNPTVKVKTYNGNWLDKKTNKVVTVKSTQLVSSKLFGLVTDGNSEYFTDLKNLIKCTNKDI